MDERWLTTRDGTRLWAASEGTGPPLVLCHGGPGLWDYFGELGTALADDLTVHRWDQRGCGRSEATPDYGLEVAVQDVQDVKGSLGVTEPWVVLGHSWGAYLALVAALTDPESTSALIYVSGTGPPGWWDTDGSRRYQAERSRRTTPGAEARLGQLKQKDRSADEEVEYRRLAWITDFADRDHPPPALDAMATSPLPINRSLNRKLSHAALHSDEDLLAACRACHVPALFIHGSEDPRPSDGARMLCAEIPNAEMVVIDGAGHFPWIERPAETLDTIGSFLAPR